MQLLDRDQESIFTNGNCCRNKVVDLLKHTPLEKKSSTEAGRHLMPDLFSTSQISNYNGTYILISLYSEITD